MIKKFISIWSVGLLSTVVAQEVETIDLTAIGRVPRDRAVGIVVEGGDQNPYGLPELAKKQEASAVKRQRSQE
ncbi:MAG: hypothetical protein ACKVHP_11730, partial [Verrucomicrobiales bacterium]